MNNYELFCDVGFECWFVNQSANYSGPRGFSRTLSGRIGLVKASDTFNVFQVLIKWLTVIETVSIIKTLRLAMF